MKILPLTIIFLFSFLYFSCSEEKKPEPKKEIKEPEHFDVCDLIEKEDIEKILNVKIKDPKKGRSQKGDLTKASFSECSFESDDESEKIFLSVYLRVTPSSDEIHSTIQSVRNSFKQSNIDVRNVEGVGDVAFWGGNQLHVFQDENNYLIITILGIKEQYEAIEKTKEVALQVIRNFGSV